MLKTLGQAAFSLGSAIAAMAMRQLVGDLPYPTYLENDATSAGYAEWFSGAKQRDMAYLLLETGIGGAVLVNGGEHHGDNHRSGEFGHMALAGKRDGRDYRVFVIMGDGEMDEGIVWEAMMTANKYKLDNYVMILDNNGLQLDGPCDKVMPGLDMSKKAADFGFETFDIDGHDMGDILDVFDAIRDRKNGKPKFINARTVKGKGVDFMENKAEWHGNAPNAEQYADAMAQLERGLK